jgi:hypothetical protein
MSEYVNGVSGLQRYLGVGRPIAQKLWDDGLKDEAAQIGTYTRLIKTDKIDRFIERYKPVSTNERIDKFLGGM